MRVLHPRLLKHILLAHRLFGLVRLWVVGGFRELPRVPESPTDGLGWGSLGPPEAQELGLKNVETHTLLGCPFWRPSSGRLAGRAIPDEQPDDRAYDYSIGSHSVPRIGGSLE